MNKKLFLIPVMLMGALVIFNSCDEAEDDDELCQAFDAVPEQCEIPTVCCPTDGGDCYYVNPDGENYLCDATLDSDENPDGCNDAMNQYITDHCTKMPEAKSVALKADLSKFTKQLMEKARLYSVCN